MHTKDTLLREIKKRVQKVAPGAEVYLYGSRARGEENSESDWDVLILVDKDKVDYAFEKEITYPLYDLEFASGEIISPRVYPKKTWHVKHKGTPFYEHISPDLIAL
ncbi:MAG: nucleotidyltransferase domain-containing protein [Cyclobacteriaceae bacterium]